MTIVSAFLSNVNKRPDYSEEKYIENGIKLLKLKIPKIIFLEKHIFDKYFFDHTYEFTKFIFFEKSQMYFYDHINSITNFNVTGNPNKDTLDYMFVCCHKTENRMG